jgi:Domain of unknown function (DUF4417)
MSEHARLRKELRPHGIVPPACHDCIHFEDCGGIQPEKALFDCFAQYCLPECDRTRCDNVCPYNPKFRSFVKEVDGLRFDDLPPVTQAPADLPPYIPLVHHASRRRTPLTYPVVALDTYKVFRLVKGEYTALAGSAEELRRAFCLAPSTRIVLRGTAKDPALERYWSYRRHDRVAEQMARLGVSLVIGPNFSHFLGVPRTDNLFNRKRQLICLGEIGAAGLSPVPHLSASQPGDWLFWCRYLRQNKTISQVAVEFQTGNKNGTEGRKVIDQMALVQDAIGRKLHPLAIGGGQFVESLAARFDRFSLLDSKPFMNAVHRQAFDLTAGKQPWRKSPTRNGQAIDLLLEQNLAGYAAWVEERGRSDRPGEQVRVAGEGAAAGGRIPLPTRSA